MRTLEMWLIPDICLIPLHKGTVLILRMLLEDLLETTRDCLVFGVWEMSIHYVTN